jgi:hypothetical protein
LITLVIACASPAQDLRPPALASDELARLNGLREATERVRVAYGAGCIAAPCTPSFRIRDEMEAVASWDGPSFRIWLHRRALEPGVEPRPAVAHELGHWLLGHTEQYCEGRAFECETDANAEAVRILGAGWGLSQEEAISLMYASLMAGLHRRDPLRGHDTPCRELSLFAQAFGRPQPPCATPGG